MTGAASAYTEETSKAGGGSSSCGYNVGGGKNEAHVAVDLRVMDSQASHAVYARTVEGGITSGGLNVGGRLRSGLGGSFDHSKKCKCIR